jgi:hypothetical protein
MAAAAKACTRVSVSEESSSAGGVLYDCQGRAAAIAATSAAESAA